MLLPRVDRKQAHLLLVAIVATTADSADLNGPVVERFPGKPRTIGILARRKGVVSLDCASDGYV